MRPAAGGFSEQQKNQQRQKSKVDADFKTAKLCG
jgi:hypothetical protein